jgi:cyclopropane-fatty-acyl-phospholipid synthase
MASTIERLLERNLVPDWLLRIGIRRLLAERLAGEAGANVEEDMRRKVAVVRELSEAPIAIEQEKANEQHYELPTEFFLRVLGKRLKYSSAYFESADATLDAAEESMLRLYCQRAGLVDGMSVLDLGCGWGSLTLYIAENYPNCSITGLSNSWTQREHIEGHARERGYKNVNIITADIAKVEKLDKDKAPPTFDRVFSIECFEHMSSYRDLLEKISRWMKPESRLFVHIFCHAQYAYRFETEGASNWMGRYFFTGGTMPSDSLLSWFQAHLQIIDRWRVDGRHYAQTSECWLQNMDANIDEIRPILRSVYGETDATKWEAYWRTFFMSVAELFGYKRGSEWYVAHYLFAPISAMR